MFNTLGKLIALLLTIVLAVGCGSGIVPVVKAQGSTAPPIACLPATSVNVNTLTSGGPVSTGLIMPQAGCTLMIDGFQASGTAARHVWIVAAPAGSSCQQFNAILTEFPVSQQSSYIVTLPTPVVISAPQGPGVCAYFDAYATGEEQSITLQYHEQ